MSTEQAMMAAIFTHGTELQQRKAATLRRFHQDEALAVVYRRVMHGR